MFLLVDERKTKSNWWCDVKYPNSSFQCLYVAHFTRSFLQRPQIIPKLLQLSEMHSQGFGTNNQQRYLYIYLHTKLRDFGLLDVDLHYSYYLSFTTISPLFILLYCLIVPCLQFLPQNVWSILVCSECLVCFLFFYLRVFILFIVFYSILFPRC